jgi:AraC-like DNA-binding protein
LVPAQPTIFFKTEQIKIMEEINIADDVVQYVITVPDDIFAGLNVSKLAVHFEVDRFRLSRQFKKCKKMTLESFISREKMFRAAFMLIANKDISVKDVAKKVGFCTCDYFIRVFRDYYGVVPGRFKQFRTSRSSIGERRSNGKDRRKRNLKSKLPPEGDRRKANGHDKVNGNGSGNDRRIGRTDRRKQDPTRDHEIDKENGTSKNCADCKHKEQKELQPLYNA